MRPIWKGMLGFGLVTVPVRVYAATERKSIRFNQLHSVCATPIRHAKWCPACNVEVPAEEVRLGYEFAKGQYVLLDESDFERAPVPSSRSITISDFVSIEEIDPVYFDKTYFVEPAEGGFRAYHLLRQAMTETGKIALGKVTLRSKESLAAVRTYQESALALQTMFFPAEVRSVGELSAVFSEAALSGRRSSRADVPVGMPSFDPKELDMAKMLISALAGPFRPEKYHDAYSEAMLEVVEEKAKGKAVVAPPPAQPSKVVDLMEALKRSVEMAKAKEREPEAVMDASTAPRA